MGINSELLERFKMKQTAELTNLKSHIGEYFIPEKWEYTEYVDAEGAYHNVLAIKPNNAKEMYRTEVHAFIEKFRNYAEVFGDEELENRPRIKITGKESKRKNSYISFVLVDDMGEEL